MKLEMDNCNRCGIFLFFDKDGIVDDYVIHMLRDLKRHMRYLLVVCNGFVTTEGLSKLKSETDEILLRANLGLDVGGYRDGLFYLGFKELANYDELILFNYTFFGPLDSFDAMFEEMNTRDVDFWGITKHHMLDREHNPVPGIRYGYMPDHLQSHFFAIRSSMFLSYQYKDFMINMRNPQNYNESICGYEVIFTKYFADMGFVWDVYSNTDSYRDYVYNPMMYRAKEMIRDLNCPIIKRRAFFTDYRDVLINTCGETSIEAFEYIRKYTPYDEVLIWDNILRLENLRDVHRQMHFNYVLPKNEKYDSVSNRKYSIWIIVQSTKNLFYYYEYFDSLEGMDIYLIGEMDKIETVVQFLPKCNLCIRKMPVDKSYYGILSEISDYEGKYDYAGVLTIQDPQEDSSAAYQAWDNTIGSKEFMHNIVCTFENNIRLGLLLPPTPIHGSWIEKIGDGWMGCHSELLDILSECGIKVNTKVSSEPLFPVQGCFWIRVNLLKKFRKLVCKKEYSNSACLLSIPFIMQSQHYYTGIVYTDEYVSSEITNQVYMLRENNKIIFEKFGAGQFHEVLNRIKTYNGEKNI